MPFKSKAQRGYMFKHMPKLAKEFAEKTPKEKYDELPEHVKHPKPEEKTSKKHGKELKYHEHK